VKKTDVVDLTIRPGQVRMVGDVGKISTGDTAKAGANAPSGGEVGAPKTMGQPSGASSAPSVTDYVPSLAGLPAGYSKGPNPDLPQPAEGSAPEAGSVQTSPNGQGVSWPAAADGSSAGGAKVAGDTLMQITGTKVGFPAGANNSAPIKDVESFG
jgi:hypothetical protein